MGAHRIDVQWAGKAGTLSIMFAFPLFLWADGIGAGTGHDLVLTAAWFFAVVGLVLGWSVLVQYVPLARDALREGRSRDRSGAEAGVR
jgi:hypothetical protein